MVLSGNNKCEIVSQNTLLFMMQQKIFVCWANTHTHTHIHTNINTKIKPAGSINSSNKEF